MITEPQVSRIRVDYEDGSFDVIENLPQDETAFYNLCRKRPLHGAFRLGIHTAGAIGAILFLTALHGKRRDYSLADPELQKLFNGFFR